MFHTKLHGVIIPLLFSMCLILKHSYGKNVSVVTNLGTIIGKTEDVSFNRNPLVVTTFLGVPFAEPPIGARRFQKPVKKSPFSRAYIADILPPECVQDMGFTEDYNVTASSQGEDCLYLNIFLPGDAVNVQTKKPVMIWIYGGGFQTGTQNIYDTRIFAPYNDVILVTINYRVSVLGFLSTGDSDMPGNYGLWDQHMAIQWVHENIENFGGDPSGVAIFGQSAGAGSVVYQSFYEGNKGLFTRAIAESGTANNLWAIPESPELSFANFTKTVGCWRDTQADSIECLRSLPVTEYQKTTHSSVTSLNYLPVVDNDFVKVSPTDVVLNKTDEAWKILKNFGTIDFVFGFNTAEGYGFMSPLDKSINSSGEEPSKGYTLDMFEKYVVPYTLSVLHVQETSALKNAILHQYVDWTDRSNAMKLKQTALDLFSDIYFNTGVIQALNAHASSGQKGNTYFYVFDYHFSAYPHGWWNGALHGEEMNFVLGFLPTFLKMYINSSFSDDPASDLPPREVDLAKRMMKYWTNFARTGNPNLPADAALKLTQWPSYDTASQDYIRFDGNLTSFPIEHRYAGSRIHFWNEFFPVLLEECKVTECPTCATSKGYVDVSTSIQASLFLLSVLITCMIFRLI